MIKIARTLLLVLALGMNANAGITPTANSILPDQTGFSGLFLQTDGENVSWQSGDGVGTVTSVSLNAPSIFSVSGSPVTTAGTIGLTLNNQNPNLVFAGPGSGGAASPTFRSLVAADIPSLSGSYATTTLSNLSNTVAIPNGVNILPANTGQVDLGSASKHFNQIYSDASSLGSIFGLSTAVSVVLPDSQVLRSDTGSIHQINWSGVWSTPNSSGNGIGVNKPMRLCTNCINAGSDYIEFGAPASFTGPVTFTLPGTNGTNGQFLQTDGSGVTSWATVSGGANTALSNLTTTSINQDLLPGTSLNNSLGSSAKRWLTAVISSIGANSINGIGTGDLDITSSGSSIININPGNIVDFNNKPTRNLSQVGLAGGGFDVLLKPAATPVGSYSLFFPPDQGTSGQTLSNDGSGNLAWVAQTSSSGVSGAIQFSGGSGAFSSDATNFFWDNSGKKLGIGTNTPATALDVIGDVSAVASATDATVSAGSFLGNVHATTNGTFGAFGVTAGATPVIDTGVVDTTLMAGIQAYFDRNDPADAGTVANGAGIYARTSQNGTDAAAHMNVLAGIAVGASVNTGTVDNLYDLYFFNNGSTNGTITNRYGIYLDVDGSYVKDSWLSGKTLIGGTSFSSHSNTLKVAGDMSAEVSATDSGASAGTFSASSDTTVSGSNTTVGINGVASATVQVGAENDKTLGGMNFAVTRGDGTDQGILDSITGSNVLMFHNSDPAGVTNQAYGYSSVFISQQGTVTDLYDYFSQRAPAGGVVTNHYGVYISNDSTTPVKNWLSGSTQFGGGSFTAPTSTIEINGALGFLDSGFSISFVAPTLSQSTAYILPITDGGSGDVLSTDGGGNLSWIPQSGGSPTGDPNTVAFFDGSGNLSDQTDFSWDGSDLQIPGNILADSTGTKSIGSSSVEYLEGWTRAIKGITNVLVQAASGNATVQGTNVVLSNGTNTLTFTGTSLNPSVNNAISLGSASNNIFSIIRGRNVGAGDGTSTLLQIDGTAGQTFPGGQAISAALRNTTNTGTHTGVFSANNSTANTVATGNLYIGTGNKLAGNANSGDLLFRVGTPFGTGVRGTMSMQDGSEGTAHYIWSSKNTTGGGSWVGSLNDASDVVSVDYLARQLFDSAGAPAESFDSRSMFDSSSQNSIDYENRFLFDNGSQPSIDWNSRQFVANDGSTVVLDYSNPAGPSFNSTVITSPAGGTATVTASSTNLIVSDARVTTNSLVIAVLIQDDLTAQIKNVVPGSGDFTINMAVAPTANTDVRYVIIESPQ